MGFTLNTRRRGKRAESCAGRDWPMFAATAQAVGLRDVSAAIRPEEKQCPKRFRHQRHPPVRGFPGLVQRCRSEGGADRLLSGSGLHDHSAVRLRHLGVGAGRAGRPHQADRPQQCLLPAVRAEVAARQGSRPTSRASIRRSRGLRTPAASPLDEWLAIRPTSEAIIADSVKDWIQSYRDLPLLMNLWNNVVRWELRTRLFLRTTEFLWQEAHAFHASREEAEAEVRDRPRLLTKVSEEWLAVPVKGPEDRGESPRGRVHLVHRKMMRDKKALQAGTSHMLGQNFAKAAGIEFLDRDNVRKHPYGTSWGFSTRMVGATIMTHGDDSGLVLPPNVAPIQVVIVPIFRSDEEKAAVAEAIDRFQAMLAETPEGRAVRVKVDWRDDSPGFKYNHWELRGVPFRMEIGPRDVAAGQAMLVKRVDRSKEAVPLEQLAAELPARLRAYQAELLQRARDFRDSNTHQADYARAAQGRAGWRGWLLHGAVVRRRRVREAGQRRHRRHHPLHPVRLARRVGEMRRLWRGVGATRPFRPSVLIAVA